MANKMTFLEYDTPQTVMSELAKFVAQDLREAIDRDGRASLCVPGGSTPGPFFDLLNQADLEWAKVSILLSDERWLPLDNPRSNTGLLKARLFQNAASAAELVPLYREGLDPDAGCAALGDAVRAVLPLSTCVLGMGADMHTASLFPGADNLELALTTDAPLVPITAPGASEPRVTLSASALNSAPHRHILILGDDKRAALEKAQTCTPQEAPVAAILQGAQIHWAPK